LDLAPALIVLPGPQAAVCDGAGARAINAEAARVLALSAPVIVVHAGWTAQRLQLRSPPRSRDIFDALELFAFVRPARFCAPSATGLALALGLPEPKNAASAAGALREACRMLLSESAQTPWPNREEALAVAETLARGGWAWGAATTAALRTQAVREGRRGDGLDVWNRVPEWEDSAPLGEPGSKAVDPDDARARLVELLARSGLDEARPAQAEFAAETAYVFEPRDREDEPNLMLAEAGTRRTAPRSGSPPSPAPCSARSSGRAIRSIPTPPCGRRRRWCARGGKTTSACSICANR
jgi:ATP-dependent DNA helicase DinG